jgi:hypothetical protein
MPEQISNITIIDNGAALTKAINKIGLAGKKLDDAIHQAAVSALWHACTFGDATFVERLGNALPRGARLKGFALWVRDFAPINITIKDGNFKAINKKGWKADEFLLAKAAAEPYWSHSPERDPGPLTVAKLLAYLKKKAEADDDGKVEPAAREAAITMLAAYQATLAA